VARLLACLVLEQGELGAILNFAGVIAFRNLVLIDLRRQLLALQFGELVVYFGKADADSCGFRSTVTGRFG